MSQHAVAGLSGHWGGCFVGNPPFPCLNPEAFSVPQRVPNMRSRVTFLGRSSSRLWCALLSSCQCCQSELLLQHQAQTGNSGLSALLL